MTIQACAELVARGDPLRFRATMAAPLAAREALLPLYAFNLEVARAPWLTQEPMIAEMRLQFWRDVVEEAAAGKPARAHEVAAPLTNLIQAKRLPGEVLDNIVAARRWDIYKEAHEDAAALSAYLDDTAGSLMWAAALVLGAKASDEIAVRALGQATGVAALFQAVPDLEARGRIPLVDARAEAIAELANTALINIDTARRAKLPKAIQAALWPSVSARTVLQQASQDPARVAQGTLEASDLGITLRLARYSLLGGY
jgi:phytoene synthase